MRFFIALDIPEENSSELIEIQKKIKQIIPQSRLSDKEKMHLTIAFIGDQPDSLKTELIKIINEAAEGVKAFTVSPGYIDGFPNIHHPLTLWIGVNGEIDNLLVLGERIKDGLKRLQLPQDDRRYTPHITLAKVNDTALTKEQEVKLQQLALQEFKPIRVSSIRLFESIPNHGFHSHNTLAEIKLI